MSSSVHRGHEVARGVDASPLAPLAFAAAAIHVWAAIEHASESAAIASAFVAMAVAQLLFGARLLRRTTPAVALMGAGASLAIAALWVATRTVHVPLLPETPEPIGAPDLAASLLEMGLAAAALAIVRRSAVPSLGPVAWGLAAALATTPLAHAGGAASGIHALVHAGLVAAAFAVFAHTVVERVRASGIRWSLALRPTEDRLR